jgi:hypothetical protein
LLKKKGERTSATRQHEDLLLPPALAIHRHWAGLVRASSVRGPSNDNEPAAERRELKNGDKKGFVLNDWLRSHGGSRHVQFDAESGELLIVGEDAHGLDCFHLLLRSCFPLC